MLATIGTYNTANPFDPVLLFFQFYNSLRRVVDTENTKNLRIYLEGYKQVEQNWRLKGVKLPLPQPAKAWELEADIEKRQILYFGQSRTGQLVTEPKPAPWDKPSVAVKDNIYFGPQVDGWPGAYYATHKTTVPAGTVTTRKDEQYVLVEMGKPGSIIYRKLWVPVTDPVED